MEYINISNKEYKFVIGNRKDDNYRMSFNELTERTFGFNLEQWYQDGYWKNQYIPYSLMADNKVVSNVSVNIMNMNVYGKTKQLIQLGTVMTDVAYRNQGLLRVLLEKVIADWKTKCDYIYLFANESVLDLYPKFGFTKFNQFQCTKLISKNREGRSVKKLIMSNKYDREYVFDKAKTSFPIAQISMLDNAELIMFYCTLFQKDNVYYIRELDTVIVANFEYDTLEIYEVFCNKEDVSLDKILFYMLREETTKVKLYFTPKETESYKFTPLEEDTLFILGSDTMLQNNRNFMFPILSHT